MHGSSRLRIFPTTRNNHHHILDFITLCPTAMATSSSPSTSSSISQPWIYFLSGALLPTISYFLLFRPKKRNDDDNSDDNDDDHDDSEDDSDDDDLFGIETSGPSSKWSIMDAPYKVSIYCGTAETVRVVYCIGTQW